VDLGTAEKELMTTAALRLECFEKLVSQAEEQRSILVEGRHADLEPNLSVQDRLLVEIGRLDQRENKLIEFIGRGEAFAVGAKHLPGHMQNHDLPSKCFAPTYYEIQYNEIRQRIKNVAVRLRSVMQINTELLENVARYVSFSLAVIAKVASDHSPHSRRSSAAGASVLLDGKA
jgi:hypothetical protein